MLQLTVALAATFPPDVVAHVRRQPGVNDSNLHLALAAMVSQTLPTRLAEGAVNPSLAIAPDTPTLLTTGASATTVVATINLQEIP